MHTFNSFSDLVSHANTLAASDMSVFNIKVPLDETEMETLCDELDNIALKHVMYTTDGSEYDIMYKEEHNDPGEEYMALIRFLPDPNSDSDAEVWVAFDDNKKPYIAEIIDVESGNSFERLSRYQDWIEDAIALQRDPYGSRGLIPNEWPVINPQHLIQTRN